jgi:cytochrome b
METVIGTGTLAMPSLVSAAYADDDDEHGGGSERAEEFWEDIHEVAANLTLLLVLLHIAGVIIASRSHHENLVKAMLSGRKRGGTEPASG